MSTMPSTLASVRLKPTLSQLPLLPPTPMPMPKPMLDICTEPTDTAMLLPTLTEAMSILLMLTEATSTPMPMPLTAMPTTTSERGPLMLSPRLRLTPLLDTMDTTDTEPTDIPTDTDTTGNQTKALWSNL